MAQKRAFVLFMGAGQEGPMAVVLASFPQKVAELLGGELNGDRIELKTANLKKVGEDIIAHGPGISRHIPYYAVMVGGQEYFVAHHPVRDDVACVYFAEVPLHTSPKKVPS